MYISFGTGNPGTDGDKLLDRSVHLKVLSIMTITRVRVAYSPGRQADRRGDTCFGEWSDARIWVFYRKYAGCGRVNKMTGADFAPVIFRIEL